MLHRNRRVITGFSETGASTIVADGPPPLVVESEEGGPESAVMWSIPGVPTLPVAPGDPTVGLQALFPKPGGSCLMMVTHPPGSGVTDGSSDGTVVIDGVEFDSRGMHASESVDYIIVVEGQIWLELDDNAEVVLSAGDVLVQNGTRHGWRNRGEVNAVVAVVLLGAERAS